MPPQKSRTPANVSMKHIAELAGVSLMTVSRALKDNPRQSKATRERVQKIARDLGYSPHPYVSALMDNLARTRSAPPKVNMAVLHFDPANHPPRHDYFDGILARAQALGYHAEAVLYQPEVISPDRLRKILLARGIRGIIIMPALQGFASIDFDFDGFAAAAMGHSIVHPPLARVGNDIYSETFHALDEMVRRGYRRVGMISTEYVNSLARYLFSAAILAYRSHIAKDLHLVEWAVPEPNLAPKSLARTRDWVRREKLDAILCPSFSLLLYEILLEQGFDIPGELGYLHLLNYPDPDVTSLNQMSGFMGAKAVDIVVAAINRNEFHLPATPYIISVPSEWHEGRTLPHRSGLPATNRVP